MREKVLSAVPSVELRNGELRGCTTIRLREALTEKEWTALQEYLLGQFSDGWGESFEQRELSVPAENPERKEFFAPGEWEIPYPCVFANATVNPRESGEFHY